MIEFKGVYKTYDTGIEALKDVNIHIDKGEFVFIVGASGAGKSTFLKLIMREEVPTAGEVIINDFRLSKLKRRQIPYLRRTMGIDVKDALEIYVEGDTIMLRKYEPSCVFCGNAKDIIHFKGKNVCSTCARELGML